MGETGSIRRRGCREQGAGRRAQKGPGALAAHCCRGALLHFHVGREPYACRRHHTSTACSHPTPSFPPCPAAQVMLPQIQRALADAKKQLEAAEQVHSSAQRAVQQKEKERKWVKF